MLTVADLDVRYGAIQAVRGVDLEVTEGEIVALLGANGAGKTTTLNAMVGLARVAEGEVQLRRRRSSPAATPRTSCTRGMTLVPEGRRVFASLTVAENLHPRRRQRAAIPPAVGAQPRGSAGAVPDPRRAQQPGGRHALRRPAAAARDRPRADVGAEAPAAGRAVARPRAAGGRRHLRPPAPAQGAAA